MKYLLVILILFKGVDVDPQKIARLNKQKEKARIAYESGKFEEAVEEYRYLIDSLGYDDDFARLNLSNAYYQLNDTLNSMNNYRQLTDSQNNKIRSIANQQLGVLANKVNQRDEALTFFKKALRDDPTNEDARYNYELLKKQQQQEQQQNQDQQNKDDKNKDQQNKDQQNKDQQNKDQQNKDQQNKDQQNKDQQNKDQKEQDRKEQDQQKQDEQKQGEEEQQQEQNSPDKQKEEKERQDQLKAIQEKLQQMNISPEKAKMILEAMKNNEIQYLQQNKRKPNKKKDSSKPDW